MVQSNEEQYIGLKLHTAHNSGHAVRLRLPKCSVSLRASHTPKPLGEMHSIRVSDNIRQNIGV